MTSPTAYNNPYNSYMNGMNYTPTGQSAPQYGNMPQINMQNVQNMAIQGRMVTSKEEALGIPVDFSGNYMYFPDMAHGCIYTKKLNMNTGAADFEVYVRMNPQQVPQPISEKIETPTYDFAPLQDFQHLNEMVSDMQNTIADLEKEIDRLKKPANSNGKVANKNEASSK